MRTITDIVGYHIHLVKFDTIVSDGAANGWNNIAGARQYETLIERFFADVELNTVFFHDHLFANSHQQHGAFGALIVEEAGATFHDVRTGKEINHGAKAVIRRRNGTSFREFALFVHDFALLFDKNGEALNPPEVPGAHEEQHAFNLTGMSWKKEVTDVASPPLHPRPWAFQKHLTYELTRTMHRETISTILVESMMHGLDCGELSVPMTDRKNG